jgi:hypothetical protein
VTRPILIIPGYNNSGPGHWQSIFERKLPSARRVEMPSWRAPLRNEWVEALEDAVAACNEPPLLVAHSLGCVAVAHWARVTRHAVHAAFLVAPCDVDKPGLPSLLRGFRPAPLEKLEFPSLLAASSDDPYLDVERAQDFAHGWGSHLRVLGRRGHINVSAGFGPWLEGEALLRELL